MPDADPPAPGSRPARLGHTGLGVAAASLALVLLTGALGPSAAQPPLGAGGRLPPYWLSAGPPADLVSGLLVLAVLAGAAGLALALAALARGWRPVPRRVVIAGVVAGLACLLVPPMGSADHLSYAAYGRIAALGGDPYLTPPDQFAGGADPVASRAESPWQDTPSIYGPLATLVQRAAAALGGDSTHRIVLLLSLVNVAAFVVTGLLLVRLAGPDPASGARAGLLWLANPLLWWALVVGAHLDTLAMALVVASWAVLPRHGRINPAMALLAGTLIGAAASVKLTYGLFGVALLWATRRQPGRAGLAVAGGAAVGLALLATAGPHAFHQLRAGSRLVSLATPWRLLNPLTDHLFGPAAGRSVLLALAAVSAVALVAVAARVVPAAGTPGADEYPRARAVTASLALAVGWLFAATYALPWYDAALWAPLALARPSVLDGLAGVRTLVLALAYLPGRAAAVVHPPAVSLTHALFGFRVAVAPVVMLGLVVTLLLVARRRARRPVPAVPPPPATRSGSPPLSR